ncbi:hypothetical protein [Streptococcus oralis]|uniref:hypothetical protein n=1 Tax=Streptococcus oralis TaxID=1303 RepID=UPI0019D31AF8|nr:hypothetical protein [Streptococcus oralis subsp. oralis]
MITLIKELIKYVGAFNDVVGRINIDSKEHKFIYILEFEISEKELDSFKEKINSYKINELDITCNNYPLESCKETKEINKVAVTMKQNQFPLEGQSLYFRNSNDFYTFEKKFLKSTTFESFKNRNTKIKIWIPEENSDIYSPVFSLCEEKLQIPDILLSKTEFNHNLLYALPKIILDRNFDEFKSATLDGFLCIVSERKISKDEYIISFEKNAILEMKSIEIDNIDLFGVLNQLFDFIFYDDKTYYEKLIIFRNVFSEFIKRQNTISNKDFQCILKDVQSNYNLFINDKLKKFISDKQKLTEDFSKLQKEILISIKNISNTISQQFLVLIVTILTTFVFKNFNTRLAMSLTVYSGIFYLICIIIVNKVRGWDFDSKSIISECDAINKNYDMLYSIDKSYINNLKDSESYRTELKQLEKIETLYKRFIYGLLCILIVILILIYKHNELYTQFTFYKQIVDLLLP